MSAGGLARLGVRCADASTGMATIGVFCGAISSLGDPNVGGGEGKKRRQYAPGVDGNRELAMREDEEVIAVIQAYLSMRKH